MRRMEMIFACQDWEEEKVQSARIWAAFVWTTLLALLLVLMWFAKGPLANVKAL